MPCLNTRGRVFFSLYGHRNGVEQGKETSHDEEIVSASVQSLVRRLEKFQPDNFDVLVTDECHHATAPSYLKIYNYFKPRLHVGFTAQNTKRHI